MHDQVTFIVKSFERPRAVSRLLKSVDDFGFGDYPVVVVDDSKQPLDFEYKTKNTRVIQTEYDVGLSEGRNVGLRACDTPYFLLLDDDMFFTHRTRVKKMIKQLERTELDMLGGLVSSHAKHAFGIFERHVDDHGQRVLRLHFMRYHERHPDWISADYIGNFLVGRVDTVLGMGGWPSEIKIGREHVVFFAMAQMAGLKVGINRSYRIGHGGIGYGGNLPKRRRTRKYNIPALNRMECDVISATWPNGRQKFGWSRNRNGYLWGKKR